MNLIIFIISTWSLCGSIILLIEFIYVLRISQIYGKYSELLKYKPSDNYLEVFQSIGLVCLGGPLTICFILTLHKEISKEIKEVRENETWYKLKEHGGWL